MCMPNERDMSTYPRVVLSTPGWSVMSGEDPERRTDVGSSQTPARRG